MNQPDDSRREGAARLILSCAMLGWLAQLALALTLPYVADEAYYARWGERLGLGYLDHPPAVAWWSAWGGRTLNLTALPIAWLLFESAARRLGASITPFSLLAAAWLTPLGLSSGVLVTPDAPLLLGWSVAVWGYATRNPLMSALGVAWGAWSKAMIWPAALGLGWLWLSDPRAISTRARARQCLIWLVMFGLLYAPHVIWSARHEWLPWSFQSGRAWSRPFIIEWVGGQLLVGGGLWAVTVGRLMSREFKRRLRCLLKRDDLKHNSRAERGSRGEVESSVYSESLNREERARHWFWLSAPSAITWTLVSFGTRAEANWSALAWPMGLVWALDVITLDELKRHLRWGSYCVIPCLALPIAHLIIPIGLGPPRGGRELAACVQETTSGSQLSSGQAYWFTGRYQEAALLGLSLDGRSDHIEGVKLSYARALGRRLSQYDVDHPAGGAHQLSQEIIHHTHIPCGAIYLGPPEWVGDRCVGEPELIQASRERCHLEVSRCVCSPPTAQPPRLNLHD